jgi:hypothetical protein
MFFGRYHEGLRACAASMRERRDSFPTAPWSLEVSSSDELQQLRVRGMKTMEGT